MPNRYLCKRVKSFLQLYKIAFYHFEHFYYRPMHYNALLEFTSSYYEPNSQPENTVQMHFKLYWRVKERAKVSTFVKLLEKIIKKNLLRELLRWDFFTNVQATHCPLEKNQTLKNINTWLLVDFVNSTKKKTLNSNSNNKHKRELWKFLHLLLFDRIQPKVNRIFSNSWILGSIVLNLN